RTRRAVREAERLHPPTPFVFREAREDFTLLSRSGAFAVKRGELLWGVLEIAQRDPACFADPDRYDPDRFADPANAAMLAWPDGPPAPAPAPGTEGYGGGAGGVFGRAAGGAPIVDRVCAARDESQVIVQMLLSRLLPRYRWVLTEIPDWGKRL